MLSEAPWQKQCYGKPFPLLYTPAVDGATTASAGGGGFVALQEFMIKHHQRIQQEASEFGAVMFEGFDIASGEEFASIINALNLQETEYIGGAAVRKLIVGHPKRLGGVQVVTTNESPSTEPIPFHHELAQTPLPPSHIAFYCHTPAVSGGSTPIVRSDIVYDFIQTTFPDLTAKFEAAGVRYARVVPQEDDASSAIGRSWRTMFGVSTKSDAEKAMKEQQYEWEWLPQSDGTEHCRIVSKVLPAVRVGTNGRKVFYNQILAAYTGWVDTRNTYGAAVRMGDDNSEIPKTFIDALDGFMKENACPFPWTAGAFVVVDNSVTYHARQPFEGRRTTYASIAQGVRTPPKAVPQTNLCQTLSSGDRMPMVGLGLWKIPNDATEGVVFDALRLGYRTLDSACDYGNELEAGRGIVKALKEGVLASRAELFVTSKLWNTYHRKEHVRAACERTLKDLGLDYLDLYLVHFPIALKFVPFETRYPPGWNFHSDAQPQPDMLEDNVSFEETWRAMEQLVEDGLVRNIGVCNMSSMMLRDVCNYAKVRPSVLQVEMHPLNTQQTLLRFCRRMGIQVTAFSNLGAGSYVPLGMAKASDSVLTDPRIEAIAARHGKTGAQVVLRWGLQRGTAIVPKTTSTGRLQENLSITDFQLSKQEMDAIDALDQHKRFNDPGVFCEAAFKTFFPIYD